MTAQELASPLSLLRLRVQAEADPLALQRVIERFQNINVVPRRLTAEFGSGGRLHIQVNIAGLAEERMTLIASKIAQAPCVFSAYWVRA